MVKKIVMQNGPIAYDFNVHLTHYLITNFLRQTMLVIYKDAIPRIVKSSRRLLTIFLFIFFI